jgi:hypothetical protein
MKVEILFRRLSAFQKLEALKKIATDSRNMLLKKMPY